jgi:hypothetical protein
MVRPLATAQTSEMHLTAITREVNATSCGLPASACFTSPTPEPAARGVEHVTAAARRASSAALASHTATRCQPSVASQRLKRNRYSFAITRSSTSARIDMMTLTRRRQPPRSMGSGTTHWLRRIRARLWLGLSAAAAVVAVSQRAFTMCARDDAR